MSKRIARRPKVDTTGNEVNGMKQIIASQREREKGLVPVRVDSRTVKLVRPC